jgi:hypothetical protein
MSDRHHRLARNRYLGDTTAAGLLATLVLKGRLGLAPLLPAHALPDQSIIIADFRDRYPILRAAPS